MANYLASLTVFLFLFLFCLSLLDIALRSVQYYKINSIRRKGNTKAQKLFTLLSSPERAISILLFCRYTLSAIFYTITGILLLLAPLSGLWKMLIFPLFLLTMLILLEYVPRMLAVQNPERVAFALIKPFEVILKINYLLPVPQLCERLGSRLLRLYGLKAEKIFSQYSVNDIKMFLTPGMGKAELELRQQLIDTKFVDFSGRRVREVMVPRPLIRALDVKTLLPALIQFVREHGYSRFPVYRYNLDNILGVLHVKDILGTTQPFSLEDHLRKPFFIPETATVQAAFQNMRRNRAHLAIVVDEYGGVDGIVTLEDLIEELIGEIQDEYDEDVELLQKVADGIWVLEGNLPIKELNQNLNLDLPEDPAYTTVAGFLMTVMDRIPNEREQIRYGKLLFSVDKRLGNKITQVTLVLPETQVH